MYSYTYGALIYGEIIIVSLIYHLFLKSGYETDA